MRMTPSRTRLPIAGLALVLSLSACDSPSPSPSIPPTPDDKPIARMTAAQFRNTASDLFAPATLREVALPHELDIGAFDNNVEVTTATSTLVEAYHAAALTISRDVVTQLDAILPCARGERACGHSYVGELAERAYRRPLDDAERQELLTDFDAWMDAHGFDAAVELTIQLLLQSPDHIYFVERGLEPNERGDVQLSSWEVASRLSYFLWDTMPDAQLFELARQDKLRDREAVADEVLRMLSDSKASHSVMRFHRQLFDLHKIGNNGLDPDYHPYVVARYPNEDVADFLHIEMQPAMRWESELFIDRVVFGGDARLKTLLTSNRTYVAPSYAWLYGIEPSALEGDGMKWKLATRANYDDFEESSNATYFPVDLDPSRRAGVLTHIGWLHSHANPRQPSPVHRGVFVLNRLLCKELTVPTDVPALETTNAGKTPRTNRDRYATHTEQPACRSCHESIDGVGFAFEGYDSLGHWREEDNGYPVDTSGALVGTDQDGPVANAVELMHKLGDSRTVHDCYTRQWFRFAFGRNESEADADVLTWLSDGFWEAGGDVRELMINIATSYGFMHRRTR